MKPAIVFMRMRYAIIADIHANLAAFAAVLDDIERRGGVGEIRRFVIGILGKDQICMRII